MKSDVLSRKCQRLKAIAIELESTDAKASELRRERTQLWRELHGSMPVTEMAELSGVARDSIYQFFAKDIRT